MKQFKAGTKVRAFLSNGVRTGYIVKAYDDIQIAIVKFEPNVPFAKVHYDKLMIIKDEDTPIKDDHREDTVIIERKDFEKQLMIVTNPDKLVIEGTGKITLFIASRILSKELVHELFGYQDNIKISHETLMRKIAEVTNPIHMMSDETTPFDLILPTLCLTIGTLFIDVLNHYFGDDLEND